MTDPIEAITQEQPETTCNMESRGRKSDADASAGTTIQASPLPDLEANPLPNLHNDPLPSLRADLPTNLQVDSLPKPQLQSEPFKFQGVPDATPFAPPSQPFSFEASVKYPTPVLSSGSSPINIPTRSSPTNLVSDIVHQFERLGHEDDAQLARTVQPAPPAIFTRAEMRRIRHQHQYKQVAAMHARAEAERVAKEVILQVICDDNEAKVQAKALDRRHNERKSAPFVPSPSPATVVPPQTTFLTTLAYGSPSGASHGFSLIGIQPLPRPVRPVITPIPQPSAPESTPRHLQPRHSRDQPTPKGVLRKLNGGRKCIVPRPPRSVRFSEAIDVREYSSDSSA